MFRPISLPLTDDVEFGGATAFNEDLDDAIFGGLWTIVLFILVTSYVVLLFLFRSLLLPLKAVLMNLLSIRAAYGVTVAVFQWGWLD
jgi:RND superfamily putative drug exporter